MGLGARGARLARKGKGVAVTDKGARRGGSGPRDQIADYVALQRRLVAVGLYWGIDLEILKACSKPIGQRGKTPPQGANLVYDRHYEELDRLGLIKRFQAHEAHTSLADDHYVLTPKGIEMLTGVKGS